MSGRFFISHASEDKDDFVRPLAHALKRRGINVWYDEFSLKVGDSLRRSIDKGLLECDFGVVVLSHSFFQKEWPQRELDALVTAEISGVKRVIPIWHNIDATAIALVSPMLADKVALQSKKGPEAIAEQLISLLPEQPGFSGEILASIVESFLSREAYVLEYLRTGCQYRFLQIQAFLTAYERLIDARTEHLDDEEVESEIENIVEQLEPEKALLLGRFGISGNVEVVDGEALPENRLVAWMNGFEDWVSGTQDPEEADSFLFDLDTYLDVDPLYVLFGLPNYAVSLTQRELLDDAVREIGVWFKQGSSERIESICATLRSASK